MKAAGLDGFEFECYGHLTDSFWSPATNNGPTSTTARIDNRLRFTFRILEAVRKAVGPDFIVGCRLVADEDWDNGLSKDDGIAICHKLKDSGLVDFLNIINGHIEHDAPLADVIPVSGMKASPHLDFAGEVRAATRFPVFHAARINDVATARHAIAEGKLDMVGMTRAHIADPHIVRKIDEGREHEIRPCVGATYCLDRIYEGHEALCIHNPATGREATMPHVISRSTGPRRRIAIVGAGPAGLEAARVSAERGHEVILFEAASQAGGQIRLATQLPRRRELIGIVDWRVAQCERLGVDMRYNTIAEASDILALDADVVFIATGGLPRNEAIEEGAELAVSSWDILSGDVKPAEDVLLFDDNGAHPGMSAAERISDSGSRLEIVSPERFFAAEMGGLNLVPYMQNFTARGVTHHHHDARPGIEPPGQQDQGSALQPLYQGRLRGTAGRSGRGREWHIAAGGSLFRAEGPRGQPRRGRPRRPDRRPPPGDRAEPGRPVPALPHRRCRRLAQHPCRHL